VSRRMKRLSREEDDQEEAMLPTSLEVRTFTLKNSTTMMAAFVTSFVWFANVVSPLVAFGPQGMEAKEVVRHGAQTAYRPGYQAVGSFMATGNLWNAKDLENAAHRTKPAPKTDLGSTPLLPFVLTCAIVHTFVVGVGIAFGRDTLSMRAAAGVAGLIARVGVSSFVFLCGVYWLAWEYKIGPVPTVGERLFSSEQLFVLVSALHTTAWLTCSMAVPHSPLGHLCTSSSKMHLVIAVIGAAVHASGLSARVSCGVFGVLGAAGLLAAQLVKADRSAPIPVHRL